MTTTLKIGSFLAAGLLAAASALAGSFTMTVTVDDSQQGAAYSSNFTGLSFETGVLKPNNGTTGYLFDTNTSQSPKCGETIQLVENMGIKNVRVGGGSVDSNKYGTDYTSAGIDALFAFASRTGLKVIYSVRLLGSSSYDPQTDSVNAAKYVWNNYSSLLDFFAVGNEPNWHSYHIVDPEIFETTSGQPGTAYPSYVHSSNGEWKEFANAIVTALPSATFGGPDTGDENGSTGTWWNNGTASVSWTQAMIDDRKSGNIAVPMIAALQHNYPGGSATGVSQTTAITDMLSTAWTGTLYPQMYNQILKPVSKTDGWHYRFTECNDYTGGVSGASNAFAAALWALDYMHWQASNDTNCVGVNFHNYMGKYTDTIYQDGNGDYHSYPKAAAIKMFNLGGAGNKMNSVTISRSTGANVNAYAVGNSTDLYVTIINKTSQFVGDWTSAVTTVVPTHFTAAHAYYIEMDSSPTTKDVTASDATVGGSSLNNNSGSWSGSWSTLSISNNQVTVSVPSATAGIVHLTTY